MLRIPTRRASLGDSPRLLVLGTLLALAACADPSRSAGPIARGATSSAIESVTSLKGNKLATIEQEENREVLYVQNADGSNRTRVHFQNVQDHVAGNYPASTLPVTDESILAIRRAKWSPDGQTLAVIVVPAIDVAEVVLVSADGHALRTVSPNSQYLYGDVEWSPDSRRVAYAMATGAFATRPDLFVTDLGPDRVQRVTTSGLVSGFDTFRFDATGNRIDFTEHAGLAADGVNTLSRVSSADLATGVIVPRGNLVGEPQGIARGGSWALVMRWNAEQTRELARVSLPAGAETVLASAEIWNAVLLEGDTQALIVSPDPNDRSGVAREFRVIGVGTRNDVRATLPTGRNVNWAAVAYR